MTDLNDKSERELEVGERISRIFIFILVGFAWANVLPLF